jgi:hypothetical protein
MPAMPMRWPAAPILALWVAVAPSSALAQSANGDLLKGLLGAGWLGAPGYNGAVLSAGVRSLPLPRLALAFDLGYGVIAGSPEVQDRWWLMPSVALAIPVGGVALDAGLGLGLGASSGYRTWPAYAAAPFGPVWAFQLVPAVRGHLLASRVLDEGLELFVRADLSRLLLGGTELGSRVPPPHIATADLLWFDLALGVEFSLL